MLYNLRNAIHLKTWHLFLVTGERLNTKYWLTAGLSLYWLKTLNCMFSCDDVLIVSSFHVLCPKIKFKNKLSKANSLKFLRMLKATLL